MYMYMYVTHIHDKICTMHMYNILHTCTRTCTMYILYEHVHEHIQITVSPLYCMYASSYYTHVYTVVWKQPVIQNIVK